MYVHEFVNSLILFISVAALRKWALEMNYSLVPYAVKEISGSFLFCSCHQFVRIVTRVTLSRTSNCNFCN